MRQSKMLQKYRKSFDKNRKGLGHKLRVKQIKITIYKLKKMK